MSTNSTNASCTSGSSGTTGTSCTGTTSATRAAGKVALNTKNNNDSPYPVVIIIWVHYLGPPGLSTSQILGTFSRFSEDCYYYYYYL